jgi:hypothetical protein
MSQSTQTPVTAFAETAALFHVLNDDLADARRIVAEMFPSERAVFAEQLDRLRDMLGARCESCDELTPVGTSVTTNPLSPDRKYLCRRCHAATQAGAR